MSLGPQPIGPVPEETARVAHAIFPQGHLYLTLRDELGHIFSDLDFAPLFPRRGQPAEAPWCLALVSVLQYAENLSDRQAAHAVRSRIDWKYLLGLALTDTGFDASVLSEFRSRVVTGSREQEVLNTLLNHCRERQWLSARGRQRTDSTHVLGMIRALNRLECVGETMRHALNSLATVAPDWLVAHSDPDWIERYGHRVEDYRLPKDKQERSDYGGQIGKDGYSLLAAVAAADAPAWLAQVPAVETLRQVWVQQYYCCETAIQWRTETEGFPPASHMINSPYDPEAHDAKKRTTTWVGYRVHLTESCDENRPHIITHVETTAAPTADGDTLPAIHQGLQQKDLLPNRHLVDTGYVDAHLLVESRTRYGVELYGPARPDSHRQASEAKGFAADQFTIDWDQQQATCPRGCRSKSWTAAEDAGTPTVKIKFSCADCTPCPSRWDCTQGKHGRRTVTLRPHAQHEALRQARQRQQEEDFAAQYGQRAGIEGTLSQGVRAFGLRRARYVGQPKTHFQHILIASSINLVRMGRWLAGESQAHTRQSRYVRLMQPHAA